MRKLLFSGFLASLLLFGVSPNTHANFQAQSGQQDQAKQDQSKSVSGKVTAIGNAGHAFSVETDDGRNKRTMDFVVDKNTQIQGRVTTGTAVTVEYQTSDGGQNVARNIMVQGGE